MNCDLQNILENEWDTIDRAMHNVDLSAELQQEINDHSYLKFSSELFVCYENKTIELPVSAPIKFTDDSSHLAFSALTLFGWVAGRASGL